MNLKSVGCDDIQVQSKGSAASKSSWEQTTAVSPGLPHAGGSGGGGGVTNSGWRPTECTTQVFVLPNDSSRTR